MDTRPAARLTRVFADRAEQGRAALIPYLTAGYPDASATRALLDGLVDAGADIIELGVPFSDPVADGPTIQATSFKALEAGMTLREVLDILREFRSRHETPVVLFTYLNPVLRFGLDAFLPAALSAGADGILLTDLPRGADPALEAQVEDMGLALIRLVAPTTPRDRLAEIADGARGFLYYISRTGVTGARQALRDELTAEVGVVREAAAVPVAVGFGISTPGQAVEVAGIADGVVVGSALMKALDRGGVEGAVSFVRALREGMDGAG